jgi:hypothetical protein
MKLFSLFLLFILPLSLAAEDSEWFVGVDGGVTGVNFSSSTIESDYEFAPEYGLKIGLRDKNSRIYLGYTAADNIDSNISSTSTAFLALEGISDEFYFIAESTAKFFFGVRLGADTADINGDSTTAFMGGLQTGLLFLLPADLEIELAYRHYFTMRKVETNFNAGTLYGALNYKFYAF